MFKSARDYKYANLCIFKKDSALYGVYLSITSFLNIYLQKIYIDCRRKLHSIHQRDLKVYIGSIDKKYLSFLGLTKP